jgi:hypothetical protein
MECPVPVHCERLSRGSCLQVMYNSSGIHIGPISRIHVYGLWVGSIILDTRQVQGLTLKEV